GVAAEPQGAAGSVEEVAPAIEVRDVRTHEGCAVEDRYETAPLEQKDAVGREPRVQAGGERDHPVVVERHAAREPVEGPVERRRQAIARPRDDGRYAIARRQHRTGPAEEDGGIASGGRSGDRVE